MRVVGVGKLLNLNNEFFLIRRDSDKTAGEWEEEDFKSLFRRLSLVLMNNVHVQFIFLPFGEKEFILFETLCAICDSFLILQGDVVFWHLL